MKQKHLLTLVTLHLVAITGCSSAQNQTLPFDVCSDDWYTLVDAQVSTGDGRGHGPDVGSTEWRSVVEFKLGIREDKQVPSLESEQWCQYINNHYIKTGA